MKRCILGVITFFLSVQYGISIDIASYTFNNYGEICQGVYTINEDPFDNITEIAVTANRRMGIKIDMCGSTDYAITRIEIRKGDEVIATSEMSRTCYAPEITGILEAYYPYKIRLYIDTQIAPYPITAAVRAESFRPQDGINGYEQPVYIEEIKEGLFSSKQYNTYNYTSTFPGTNPDCGDIVYKINISGNIPMKIHLETDFITESSTSKNTCIRAYSENNIENPIFTETNIFDQVLPPGTYYIVTESNEPDIYDGFINIYFYGYYTQNTPPTYNPIYISRYDNKTILFDACNSDYNNNGLKDAKFKINIDRGEGVPVSIKTSQAVNMYMYNDTLRQLFVKKTNNLKVILKEGDYYLILEKDITNKGTVKVDFGFSYPDDYLLITEIFHSIPSSIAANNQGQFIEFYNPTERPIEMKDWKVKSEFLNEEFQFPDTLIIPPKGMLLSVYRQDNQFQITDIFPQLKENEKRIVIYRNTFLMTDKVPDIKLYDWKDKCVDQIDMKKDSVLFSLNTSSDINSCRSVQRCNSLVKNGSSKFFASFFKNGQVSPLSLYFDLNPSDENIPSMDESPEINLPINYTGKNAITSVIMTKESKDLESIHITSDNSLTNIQYFDGLGRIIQNIEKNISPSGADLISTIEYDNMGNAIKEWVKTPVPSNNGAYFQGFVSVAQSFHNEEEPYTEKIYDDTPLGHCHLIKYPKDLGRYSEDYTLNGLWLPDETVNKYEITNNGIKKSGTYDANLLLNKNVFDNLTETYNFTDKTGRTVLIRYPDIFQGNYDTYFIYDQYGNLRYVLPPLAVEKMTGTEYTLSTGNPLDLYAYIYEYDHRNRMIKKKLPGAEPIYIIYDKADRPILTQDGNQRERNEWSFVKYDNLSRPLLTGTLTDNRSVAELRTVYADMLVSEIFTGNSGEYGGYSNECPMGDLNILTINYYDNYNFLKLTDSHSNRLAYDSQTTGDKIHTDSQGLLTGSIVASFDKSVPNKVTVHYYDRKGREIQTRSNNHLTGYDITNTEYSFTGKPVRIEKSHSSSILNNPVKEVYTYTYDNAERPTGIKLQIDNLAEKQINRITYDELGQVKNKELTDNVSINYHYDIINRIDTLNAAPYFSEKIGYRYKNISSIAWTSASRPEKQSYGFSYNNRGWLTSASFTPDSLNFYSTSYTHDRNGNITHLERKGIIGKELFTYDDGSQAWVDKYGYINHLTFTHNGNQLKSVQQPDSIYDINIGNMVEEETEFFYDNNGNLVQDKNRSIDNIDYNILNLPNNISFKEKGLNIGFSYDAVGRKLKARYGTSAHNLFVPVGNTMPVSENDMQYTDSTDYCGNYLYENGALSKIYIPDGYIKVGKGNGSEPEYTFYQYIHDHQGNIRAVLNGNRLCYNYDYYPEGAMHGDIDGLEPQTDDRKRYNGKEHETMHGLGWYDYSARWYDPRLTVRFTTPDPKTEEFYDLSPYIYCGGDPVNYIDPDGMKLEFRQTNPNQHYGVMMVLTGYYMHDISLRNVYKHAIGINMPIMIVDNMKDFQEGLAQLKEMKTSVNAFSITQHGSPGKTSIGEEEINENTNFSSLREGLQGKNVFINACDVTKDENANGLEMLQNISDHTQAKSVVTSDQKLTTDYNYDKGLFSQKKTSQINDIATSFKIIIRGEEIKNIYHFRIDKNGTFFWNYNKPTKQ